MAAFLALLGVSPALAQQSSSFFGDSAVREIRLTFDDPNWYNTLVAAHQNANATGDPYFPCRFQYGEIVIPRNGRTATALRIEWLG
jgi:hypothetical protein